MVTRIIRNDKFRQIGSNVKPDAKKRVTLSKVELKEGVTYHVYANEIGQIVLDPQVSIPVSELWLFDDPEALEDLRVGFKEFSGGKIEQIDLSKL